MSALDGAEESGRLWAEDAGVVESCEICFCFGVADGTISCCLWCNAGWFLLFFWREGDIPETVGWVSLAANDALAVFEDVYVVFGEQGYAVIVAQLADGNEGAGLEVMEDVAGFCLL